MKAGCTFPNSDLLQFLNQIHERQLNTRRKSRCAKTSENSMNKDFFQFLGIRMCETFLLYVETHAVPLHSYITQS